MRTLLFALLLIGAAAGCSRPSYTTADEYGFMQSCEAGGPPSGVCACAWGKVKETIPYADTQRYSALAPVERANDPMTKRLLEIRQQCEAAAGATGTTTP